MSDGDQHEQSRALDDGAELVDAFLGFRAALTANGATELGALAEFVE